MRGWVATTDTDWFRYLASREDLEEVNFWEPSGRAAFRDLEPGAPFFFKLKAPHNAIGGFGFFWRRIYLPDWLAWETFGHANGAPDRQSFRARLARYRPADAAEREIGCVIVTQPVFFPPDLWVPQPRDWRRNIVRGKRYDLTRGEGLRLWNECRERARLLAPTVAGAVQEDRRGAPQIVRPRLGQGAFRAGVIDAYDRACAVTEEHSLPVLDAAHIVPFAEHGAHEVRNGLLLRTDVHRLFDKGFVTVTPDYRFEVSSALRERWRNGRFYYAFHGRRIRLPRDPRDRPDPGRLAWHNRHRFVA